MIERETPDAQTRRHRAVVANTLILGGIALSILMLVLLWWLWGFRWPPAAEVTGWQPTGEARSLADGGAPSAPTPVAARFGTPIPGPESV